MVDARDQRTTSDYDALDRLITTTDPLNGRIGYTYDAQDNLRTVTDPRNRVTTYTYNGYDELTRLESPDTGITEHTYDAAGRAGLSRGTAARRLAAGHGWPDRTAEQG